MTMPSEVESPMYTTASQEVRVAGAAFCDAVFGDAAFVGELALDDFVACAGEVVGGAACAWCVESWISAGASPRGVVEPLPSSGPITPARPAPSTTRILSATTETTLAATHCRRRRR